MDFMPQSNESYSYKWSEIVDLPADVSGFRDSELESLHATWMNERATLDSASQQSFNDKLAREWAIETGVIEDVYTLDRGVTRTLIEHGIDSSLIPHDASNRDSETVARIIRSHADGLEALFAFVKGERKFTVGYIKEIHSVLLREQPSVTVINQFGESFSKPFERGVYKTLPNNPIRPDGKLHQYCPPEHVSSEMDRLVSFYEAHGSRESLPYVEAAWLHHAFTQIHPFQDGNGRVARALATLVLIQHHYFPLVVSRDDRKDYIDALEQADAGDLSILVAFFARKQKRELTRAISMATDTRPVTTVSEALAATVELLVTTGKIMPVEYVKAKNTANILSGMWNEKIGRMALELTNGISIANKQFVFSVGEFGAPPIDLLKSLTRNYGYDFNTNEYYSDSVLTLAARAVASKIVISFHGVGLTFRGLIVAVAFFMVDGQDPIPLADDVFRINYREAVDEVRRRFETWMESCLIRGLAEWRKTLL